MGSAGSGVVVGFLIDAKALVEVARKECANYLESCGQPIPLYAYQGCAIGKAKQNATAEIEKLKLSELSSNELIKEAAKIIYVVNDEVKDKHFELELSWVGACKPYSYTYQMSVLATDGVHQNVSKNLFNEAKAFALQALDETDELDDDVQ